MVAGLESFYRHEDPAVQVLTLRVVLPLFALSPHACEARPCAIASCYRLSAVHSFSSFGDVDICLPSIRRGSVLPTLFVSFYFLLVPFACFPTQDIAVSVASRLIIENQQVFVEDDNHILTLNLVTVSRCPCKLFARSHRRAQQSIQCSQAKQKHSASSVGLLLVTLSSRQQCSHFL